MSYSPDVNYIVFFDSECVLCGNFLKLLLKIDKRKKLNFAALQSDYSKEALPESLIKGADYKTVAFQMDEKIYTHSDAVLNIFKVIGMPWSFFNVFKIFPKGFRDFVYMKISNNRYSWFGKSNNCMIPTPELRNRFVHEIF